MMRLGLMGRLSLIVLFGMMALVALVAGYSYLQLEGQDRVQAERSLPDQVAALIALFDQLTPAQRQTAFDSADPAFAMSITPVRPPRSDDDVHLPAVELAISSAIAERFGRERLVEVVILEPKVLFPRLRAWLRHNQSVEIIAPLSNSDHLVIRTTAPLTTRVFGLPAGFVLGAMGFLVAAATLAAIAREARPLRRLASAVNRFAVSAQPQQLPRTGAPDTRALIASFDAMQERIAGLVASRNILIGGISHDLRTYLTRLRLRIEAIPDEAERERAIRDVEDMDRALAQGIAYARGISTAAHREPVDLAALARADAEGHTLEGAKVTCDLPKTPVLVQADRLALARVIANLTGNALKYGTKVELRLAADGRLAELIVDDDGPGIPANLRQLVFEPFFRADEARTNPSLGTGLGLAVARDIVIAHGGTITVGDAPGGGARMTVRLPLA